MDVFVCLTKAAKKKKNTHRLHGETEVTMRESDVSDILFCRADGDKTDEDNVFRSVNCCITVLSSQCYRGRKGKGKNHTER